MTYVRWTHTVTTPSQVTVFPDGCRDVLIVKPQDQQATVRLTPLDDRARKSQSSVGTHLLGFRLQPGFVLDELDVKHLEPTEGSIESYLQSHSSFDKEPIEIIASLSYVNKTASVAKQTGVSVRTLQRQLRRWGLPVPDFWRRLGRVRHAACALMGDENLSAIACDFDYSDQAHMSREFKAWFGLTPTQLRHSKHQLFEITQSGLGNWTGEQISIK